MSTPEVDVAEPVTAGRPAAAAADVGDSLSLRQDGEVAVLVVPRMRSFDDLRDLVRAKLPEQREQIGESTLRLDLQERPIVLFDLRRLISMLRDEFQIEVTGLIVRNETIVKFAERELKLRLFVHDPTEEPTQELTDSLLAPPKLELTALAASLPQLNGSPESEPPPDPTAETQEQTEDVAPEEMTALPSDDAPAPAEPSTATSVVVAPGAESGPVADGSRRTQVVSRTLRSGTAVRFDGDITVYGDVNAGAEVVASGNILVMGALKGVAHAGCTGDEAATIFAFDLKPTQLRIGRRIAITPPRSDTAKVEPEVARVQDDQIAIEPFRRR